MCTTDETSVCWMVQLSEEAVGAGILQTLVWAQKMDWLLLFQTMLMAGRNDDHTTPAMNHE